MPQHIEHDVPDGFFALAVKFNLTPERLAELLCSTLVEINPDSLTIIGRVSRDVENVEAAG